MRGAHGSLCDEPRAVVALVTHGCGGMRAGVRSTAANDANADAARRLPAGSGHHCWRLHIHAIADATHHL